VFDFNGVLEALKTDPRARGTAATGAAAGLATGLHRVAEQGYLTMLAGRLGLAPELVTELHRAAAEQA
jgi:uncharacterized membrane protein YebE (DUF533 family)